MFRSTRSSTSSALPESGEGRHIVGVDAGYRAGKTGGIAASIGFSSYCTMNMRWN